jgi:glycosyltransferase involved in cell wall biosynthesis
VDPDRFKNDLNDNDLYKIKFKNKKPLHIGCVARLQKEKGLDVLIRSIENLHGVQLTIVGAGEEKDDLIKLVSKLKIEKRVKIIDRVDKLGAFYRSLDIFVLPSRTNDPFGLVAAEAMCCGVPVVVTTECGIAQEITDGKDGIVVKANSSDALSEALSFLIEDENRRGSIGKAGKTKALTDFTVSGMVDAYERCLQKQ